MKGPKPVRVGSANLHTTSRAPLVVPWLWAASHTHGVDVWTLQEVTPRHAWWLRKRPRWVLTQARPFTEAVYSRRRLTTTRRVIRPISGPWARKRKGGIHPGRSLPLATLRGWLPVGSVHLPPSWVAGPSDRMHAGAGMLLNMAANLPGHVPLFLDGDWNARPHEEGLTRWRQSAGLPFTRGHRIVHAVSRRAYMGPLVNIGRAPGMDHDAHVVEVSP